MDCPKDQCCHVSSSICTYMTYHRQLLASFFMQMIWRLAYAVQHKLFSEINKLLTKDMVTFVQYCKKWRLVPSKAKTVASCFHLNNKLAKLELRVMFDGEKLKHEFEPTYLRVKLDRSLTYGKHLDKL